MEQNYDKMVELLEGGGAASAPVRFFLGGGDGRKQFPHPKNTYHGQSQGTGWAWPTDIRPMMGDAHPTRSLSGLLGRAREVEEFADVLVPDVGGLGVVEGKAEFVDDLGAHGDGFAP